MIGNQNIFTKSMEHNNKKSKIQRKRKPKIKKVSLKMPYLQKQLLDRQETLKALKLSDKNLPFN